MTSQTSLSLGIYAWSDHQLAQSSESIKLVAQSKTRKPFSTKQRIDFCPSLASTFEYYTILCTAPLSCPCLSLSLPPPQSCFSISRLFIKIFRLLPRQSSYFLLSSCGTVHISRSNQTNAMPNAPREPPLA